MTKRIIAIDIDDVIADSTEILRQRINQHKGINLQPSHYKVPHPGYWGYYERVWKTHGVDVDYGDLEKEMEEDQSHVPLLAGTSFALSQLASNYDLAIVTSRSHTWQPKTMEWLKDKLGDVFNSIHFTEDGKNKKTKGQLCKEIGAEWLIDDNPEHCQSAVDEGVKAILFGEYGWHHKAPEHLIRCKDWPSVVEYFDEQGK